ncbi:MAG: DUF1565 domain-containing protein [Ignavibacteriales bacterium]|nr:DUF1565 domain-containing protein [Ignavibacteriales bacterium]
MKLSSPPNVDDSNTTGIENGSLQYPFNTIEEGLAVAQNQDTVMVATGTYTTSYLLIPKSVTIIGAGRDSTIVNGEFVLSSQLSSIPVFIYSLRCENVRCGDSDTITTITPLTIKDCQLQTLSDTTKSFDSTCTFLFKNNIVIDSIRIDWISSQARIEISNCTVGDNLSISSVSSRKNILILNNEVARSVNIWTVSRDDTIFVEQNTISDSLIILSISTYPNRIFNNNIGKGIRISALASKGHQITNNVISDGGIFCSFVALDSTLIEFNELMNGGIDFSSKSAEVFIRKNNIISSGNRTGINFTSKSGGWIDSNSVTLPYLPPTGVPPEHDSLAICAVRINSISFPGLHDNQLEGGSYGVYLKALASEVVRNTITGPDRGVYLEAFSSRVDSNSVTNCADDGMILKSHTDYGDINFIFLNNNLIANNHGNGIRLKNFATLGTDTTGYNDIRDNTGYDLYLETPKSLTDTILAKNNHWTHITESEISEFDIYDQNDDTTLALVVFIPFLLTDVDDDTDKDFPTDFVLCQNYPNPFNPSTNIKFTIPNSDSPLPGGVSGGLVTLKVYDILGREVATLLNEKREAGRYEVEFSAEGGSASGGNASTIPSGVYFYQISVRPSSVSTKGQAGQGFIQTRKMILLK